MTTSSCARRNIARTGPSPPALDRKAAEPTPLQRRQASLPSRSHPLRTCAMRPLRARSLCTWRAPATGAVSPSSGLCGGLAIEWTMRRHICAFLPQAPGSRRPSSVPSPSVCQAAVRVPCRMQVVDAAGNSFHVKPQPALFHVEPPIANDETPISPQHRIHECDRRRCGLTRGSSDPAAEPRCLQAPSRARRRRPAATPGEETHRRFTWPLPRCLAGTAGQVSAPHAPDPPYDPGDGGARSSGHRAPPDAVDHAGYVL